MKPTTLATFAALSLGALTPAAAQTNFTYTGAAQTYNVTQSAIYGFTVAGASGGAGKSAAPSASAAGAVRTPPASSAPSSPSTPATAL